MGWGDAGGGEGRGEMSTVAADMQRGAREMGRWERGRRAVG